jgi:hypothetical protein
MSAYWVPAQPVDATQVLNLSAGVSNDKVLRGRSFSIRLKLACATWRYTSGVCDNNIENSLSGICHAAFSIVDPKELRVINAGEKDALISARDHFAFVEQHFVCSWLPSPEPFELYRGCRAHHRSAALDAGHRVRHDQAALASPALAEIERHSTRAASLHRRAARGLLSAGLFKRRPEPVSMASDGVNTLALADAVCDRGFFRGRVLSGPFHQATRFLSARGGGAGQAQQ